MKKIILVSLVAFILITFIGIVGWYFYDGQTSSEEHEKDEPTLNDLLLRLDEMDFLELVQATALGSQYRDLIIWRYLIPQYQVHQKLIFFTTNVSVLSDLRRHGSLTPGDSHAFAAPIEIIDKFFYLIGEIFLRLLFVPTFSQADNDMYINTVNTYCSNTLKEFRFERCNETVMNQWQKPFEAVETLYIIDGIFEGNTTCHLNETFPNVNEMRLESLKGHDLKCIEQNYPNLERLEFFNLYSTERIRITPLLKLNPQLKSFHMWDSFGKLFLPWFNKILPNLEELFFFAFADDFFIKDKYATTHFQNVRKFGIETDFEHHSEPQQFPFTFECLEELIVLRYNITDRWIDLITAQKHLKSLKIVKGALNNQQWIQIGNKLPNLTTVTAKWNRGNSYGLIELACNHENLKEIIFLGMDPLERKAVSIMFGDEWNVYVRPTDSHFLDMSFQRKEQSVYTISHQINK